MESAWLNVLTGISQGSFDTLFVKDANGNWINILTLGASGGGGGSGVVQSAQAPLYITNGVISVDLASYLTSNQITTLLTAYSTTTQINSDDTVGDVERSLSTLDDSASSSSTAGS